MVRSQSWYLRGLDLTHSELIETMKTKARKDFKRATEKMDRQTVYKVAELVLTHCTLECGDYFKQFGDPKDGEVLLDKNIFAVDDSGDIHFENGMLESVIREELARINQRKKEAELEEVVARKIHFENGMLESVIQEEVARINQRKKEAEEEVARMRKR